MSKRRKFRKALKREVGTLGIVHQSGETENHGWVLWLAIQRTALKQLDELSTRYGLQDSFPCERVQVPYLGLARVSALRLRECSTSSTSPCLCIR